MNETERHEVALTTAHFRSDRGAAIVALEVGEAAARTSTGQVFAWALVNNLVRVKGLLRRLVILVPKEVPVLGPHIVPFSSQENFQHALVEGARTISQGCEIETEAGDEADVFVSFLSPATLGARKRLFASANRWIGGVSVEAANVLPLDPKDPNALGAIISACLAASECYKHIWVLADADDYVRTMFLNAYSLAQTSSLSNAMADENPSWEAIDLDFPYVVGAGAVAQAVAQAWLAMGHGVKGAVRIVDKKTNALDATNLSRYFLSCAADLENPLKAAIVARRLANRAGFKVVPCDESWQTLVRQQGCREGPNGVPTFVEAEKSGMFRNVLICVDKNRDRHAIQDVLPERLFQASTLELGIQVRQIRLGTRLNGCIKCFAPVETEVSDEELVQQIQSLKPDERAAKAREKGFDPKEVESWLAAKCLNVGGETLAKFIGLERRPEASISYVSCLAGTILAGQYLRSIRSDQLLPGSSWRYTYNCLSNGSYLETVRAQTNCACQRGNYAAAYSKTWTAGEK